MEHITITNDQKITVHPAARLMPMMTLEEREQLKADIRENGLKEPVVLYQGQLLDGRNRLKVCRELDIPVQAVSLSEEEDPYLHVASLNLHRRQLSTSQKAAVAAKIMDKIEPRPGQKRREIAAQEFGVSPKMVQDARKLLQENPKMFVKVFKGECTINKALRRVSVPKTSPAIWIVQRLLALIPAERRGELETIQEETSPVYAPFVGERIREIALMPLNEHIERLNRPEMSQSPVKVEAAQPLEKPKDMQEEFGVVETDFGF